MDERIIAVLEDIKKLMILDLIDRGIPGKRVAEVLGVDAATVSRIVSPKRASKK